MLARIYETPLDDLLKRARKKKQQLDEEWTKSKPNFHNLKHICGDLAAALNGINERIKKQS